MTYDLHLADRRFYDKKIVFVFFIFFVLTEFQRYIKPEAKILQRHFNLIYFTLYFLKNKEANIYNLIRTRFFKQRFGDR